MENEIRQILGNVPDKDKARKIINYIKANYIPKQNTLTKREISVGEIEKIIETWFVEQESVLSNEQMKEVDIKGVWQVDLKSLSFDEIKKGLAQAIKDKLKGGE